MKHNITIKGDSSDRIAMLLDGAQQPLIVTTQEGITAAALYDFFEFKKGETYEVAKKDSGEMQAGTFNPFCQLVEDIVEELNAVSKGQS